MEAKQSTRLHSRGLNVNGVNTGARRWRGGGQSRLPSESKPRVQSKNDWGLFPATEEAGKPRQKDWYVQKPGRARRPVLQSALGNLK